jgi:cytochrome c oxidase subunit I
MSTASFPTDQILPGGAIPASTRPKLNYLNNGGLLSWLTTVDHKRIGIMYLIFIMASFVLGGLFALALRIELFTPELDFTKFFLPKGSTKPPNDLYNQFFTLHGAIMIFLFIIPSIPAALGNVVLPMQLGAKDVAFPKINLLSYYLYVIGACFAVYSMVTGSVDTGWTFYTPYSSSASSKSVVSMIFGVFILGFSSIFTGLNFITTTHKLRCKGMTWFHMPLLVWALYATAIIQLLATPVLGITLLLLVFERVANVGIFDPLMGGDPVLFQHFFWFYSHPAVYIMILPGMGIISEVITAHSKKPIFGYRAVAFSSMGIAAISFLVWGHHMFTSGQSEFATVMFSALTFLVAIPSAVKVFNWTATLYRGSIALTAPMLYVLAFIFLFTIGGLTGLYLGTLNIDIHVHDTYFVVAHFHYVMVGGTVMAFIAGLHHWWPKMFGKMYSEKAARIAWLLVFTGFNMTFFTQFILGLKGMPRRYASYIDQYQGLHGFSSVGALVLGAGFGIMFVYLIHSLFKGRQAPDNPWGATTLEWMSSSPPPTENFTFEPEVYGEPYQYAVDPINATVKP